MRSAAGSLLSIGQFVGNRIRFRDGLLKIIFVIFFDQSWRIFELFVVFAPLPTSFISARRSCQSIFAQPLATSVFRNSSSVALRIYWDQTERIFVGSWVTRSLIDPRFRAKKQTLQLSWHPMSFAGTTPQTLTFANLFSNRFRFDRIFQTYLFPDSLLFTQVAFQIVAITRLELSVQVLILVFNVPRAIATFSWNLLTAPESANSFLDLDGCLSFTLVLFGSKLLHMALSVQNARNVLRFFRFGFFNRFIYFLAVLWHRGVGWG